MPSASDQRTELALAARDGRSEETGAAGVLAARRRRLDAVARVLTLPRSPVRVLLALAMAAGLALVAAPASAHAVLEASTPAPGALLPAAPQTVTLRFDEPVTLLPTSLRVYAPDGSRADDGRVTHPGGVAEQAAVGLDGRAEGTYLVSWRVVSDDSHPVSGAYSFSIGKRSTAPKAPAVVDDTAMSVLLGMTRLLVYGGTAVLLGGLLLVVAAGASPRTRRLALRGAWVLGVGSVLGLLLKGPVDAGLDLDAVGRPSLLGEVLGTTYGRATLVRVGLAVLGGVLAASWTRLPKPVAAVATAVLGVAVALTLALAGHSGTRPLTLVTDTIHVLAMSAWVGGLVVVLADALPTRQEQVVRRFSTIALVSVGLLVVTGVVQAWRQVGAWGALTGTTYGQDLVTKVVLALIAVAFAAGSRTLLRRASWVQLRTTVVFESLTLVAVLVMTSVLTAAAPAKDSWRPRGDQRLHLLGDTVQVSAVTSGTVSVPVVGSGSSGSPCVRPRSTRTPATCGYRSVNPRPAASPRTGAWPGGRRPRSDR